MGATVTLTTQVGWDLRRARSNSNLQVPGARTEGPSSNWIADSPTGQPHVNPCRPDVWSICGETEFQDSPQTSEPPTGCTMPQHRFDPLHAGSCACGNRLTPAAPSRARGRRASRRSPPAASPCGAAARGQRAPPASPAGPSNRGRAARARYRTAWGPGWCRTASPPLASSSSRAPPTGSRTGSSRSSTGPARNCSPCDNPGAPRSASRRRR
mmetsp:Transcript_81086/g.214880  ORF Transcript_81086/g.214880 Transcript_81086/m.214880 type:complete len:212 (-) Transcript_81086:1436-2071(-)